MPTLIGELLIDQSSKYTVNMNEYLSEIAYYYTYVYIVKLFRGEDHVVVITLVMYGLLVHVRR